MEADPPFTVNILPLVIKTFGRTASAVPVAARLLGVVLLLVVVGACSQDPIEEERAKSAPPSDRILIQNAQEAIRQTLRDPASAEFRNDGVRIVADSQRIVCGEVNSKNGFGGYAGFQRYISTGRAAFVESQMQAESFALTWKTLCTAGRR